MSSDKAYWLVNCGASFSVVNNLSGKVKSKKRKGSNYLKRDFSCLKLKEGEYWVLEQSSL
jgi:hypothetical protein